MGIAGLLLVRDAADTLTTEFQFLGWSRLASILAMPDKVQFNVYLPPDVVRAVKHRSIDEGLSLSAFVEKALSQYLAAAQKEDPR
jgi:hypothetical protein